MATRSLPVPYWGAIAFAALIHIVVVMSVVRQPLNVNRAPGATRSIIWPLHNDTVHRMGPAADFFAVYHAGIASRQHLSPYQTSEQPRYTPYYYPYRYLPIVAQTVGRGFASVAPRNAYRLWVVLMEMVLAALIYLFYRRVPNARVFEFIACALLLSSPYFLEVHMGQFTFVAFALVAIALLLEEYPSRNAKWLSRVTAMMSYSVAVLVKLVPLIIFPALIRHRRYWPMMLVSSLLVVLFAVTYFPANAADWTSFSNVNFIRENSGLHTGNFGFGYLLYRVAEDLGLSGLSDSWAKMVGIWHVVLVGATALIVLSSRSRNVLVGSAALVCAHFLSYGHVWEHHLTALIIVGSLVLLAVTTDDSFASNKTLKVVVVFSIVVLVLPTPYVFFDRLQSAAVWDPGVGWTPAARYLVLLCKVLPALTLYGATTTLLVKAGLQMPWRRLERAPEPTSARART